MIKIGRNEPCPCGSGKKYKKCCLGKSMQNVETTKYGDASNTVSGSAMNENTGRQQTTGIEDQSFNVSDPLSMMPIIHNLTQGMLDHAEEQLNKLKQAKNDLRLLDNMSLESIINERQNQQEDMPDYQATCQKWRTLKLNRKQLTLVKEFEEAARTLKKTIAEILDLARNLGDDTPDKIAL